MSFEIEKDTVEAQEVEEVMDETTGEEYDDLGFSQIEFDDDQPGDGEGSDVEKGGKVDGEQRQQPAYQVPEYWTAEEKTGI